MALADPWALISCPFLLVFCDATSTSYSYSFNSSTFGHMSSLTSASGASKHQAPNTSTKIPFVCGSLKSKSPVEWSERKVGEVKKTAQKPVVSLCEGCQNTGA